MKAFNPARRMFVFVCLIALFVAVVGMACGGSGCGDTRPESDAVCVAERQSQAATATAASWTPTPRAGIFDKAIEKVMDDAAGNKAACGQVVCP